MPRPADDPRIVLPIVELVRRRVAAIGKPLRTIASERGVKYGSLQRYTRLDLEPLKQPARPQTMRDLALALDVPLSEVEQAMIASTGYRVVVDDSADDLALVIATMKDSPEARQQLIEIARKYHEQMRQEQQKRNGGQL